MRFRRKSDDVGSPAERPGEQTFLEPATVPAVGPFDADELPADGPQRVDLGSLLLLPEPGRELRMQVDESTGQVQAVLMAGPDGAVELRAFAAPRNGDLWSTVRPQIAAEFAQKGGTATEREGRFGVELVCQLPVRRADGSAGTQPSRVIGVNGPRWLLRATLVGRPAVDLEGSSAWEDTIANVAVRRGSAAMPVGELLPAVMPEGARRTAPAPPPAT